MSRYHHRSTTMHSADEVPKIPYCHLVQHLICLQIALPLSLSFPAQMAYVPMLQFFSGPLSKLAFLITLAFFFFFLFLLVTGRLEEKLGRHCVENPPLLDSGSGTGTVTNIAGLKVYVSGHSDSKLAILLVSDVFSNYLLHYFGLCYDTFAVLVSHCPFSPIRVCFDYCSSFPLLDSHLMPNPLIFSLLFRSLGKRCSNKNHGY